MINPFKAGDKKYFAKVVEEKDVAAFDSEAIHPVYATFALGRDAEWACRLFVLDMKENDEEGIGTFLHIDHSSPALLGSIVKFEANFISLSGNIVLCSFEAKIGDRLVARGETGQKILKKAKLKNLFTQLK